jgi:uncharacterized protein YjbI with pentapeptide repeats
MTVVVDALGAWLVEQVASSLTRRLGEQVLGSEQERALREVGRVAIRRTTALLVPANAEHAAMIIGEVFLGPLPTDQLGAPAGDQAGPPATVLERLYAGMADRLAILGDATITGRGISSAQALGVPLELLTQTLIEQVLEQIRTHALGGGPLEPLARQLNDDVTHLQGVQTVASMEQLNQRVSRLTEELQSARSATVADRIAKAVEHLASGDLAVRVAGLRALEQTAQSSPGARSMIAGTLVAFIAGRAPWAPEDQVILEQAMQDDRTWTQPWPHNTAGLFNPPWIADLPRLQDRALDVDTALEVLVRLPDRGSPLTLSGVDLRKLYWESSQSVDLEGLHLNGAHFEGSYLAGVDFSSSRLLGAHFEGATMVECKFPVEMRKAHLDGAELLNCSFGRDPYGSLLVGGTLRRARIGTSDLRHAGLDHTDCRDATLACQMQGAGLQDADLRGADLTFAQLQDSSLQGARLQGASLRGANLTGAALDGAQLDGAFANIETVWPDGFEPRNAGVIIVPGTVLDQL